MEFSLLLDSVPSALVSSPEELEIITVNLKFLNGPITCVQCMFPQIQEIITTKICYLGSCFIFC